MCEPDEHGVKVCRIDGNSRTESLMNGRLSLPAEVMVITHEDLTDEQVEKLYESLNSPKTAETPNEKKQHMNKLTSFEPKSKYVSGQWKTAIDKCGRGLTYDRETMEMFKPALMVIDDWNIKPVKGEEVFKNGVKRAIINSLVIIGEDGKVNGIKSKPSEFWKEVLRGIESVPEVGLLKEVLKGGKTEQDHQQSALDYLKVYEIRQAKEVA